MISAIKPTISFIAVLYSHHFFFDLSLTV